MMEIQTLHFLGEDSGQSHSLLVDSVLSGPSEQEIGCDLSWPFLERNFRESEEEGGGGQGEVENILPPQMEKLQGVCQLEKMDRGRCKKG